MNLCEIKYWTFIRIDSQVTIRLRIRPVSRQFEPLQQLVKADISHYQVSMDTNIIPIRLADRQRFYHNRQTGVITLPPVQFKGPMDCFLIELHAMRKDVDDRMVLCLLQAAFETYPDRSYCIMSVPSGQRHIPLLSYFVVRIVLVNTSLNDALLCSLCGDFDVESHIQTGSNKIAAQHFVRFASQCHVQPDDCAANAN